MRIAIVEDDVSMQERLKAQLLQWNAAHQLPLELQAYSSGADFLAAAREEAFSLVFMDIYMESDNGIDTALAYRALDVQSLLIFLTSSPDHYREAFPCRAFDYLLKPVEDEVLRHTLDEALRLLRPEDRVLRFTAGGISHAVHYRDIRFILSQQNYCLVQTDQARNCRMTFSALTQSLNEDQRFCFINRGIVVNLDYVESFAGGECLMKDRTKFPLHSRKQAQFVQLLIDHRFQKRDEHIRRF